MEAEQQKKKMVKLDHWLHTDIVVKIVTKRLGEKYFKKKGVIKVRDTHTYINSLRHTHTHRRNSSVSPRRPCVCVSVYNLIRRSRRNSQPL